MRRGRRGVILAAIVNESPQRSVAFITGGARGIGAATARYLAARGWAVAVADRCTDDPDIPYPLGTRADIASIPNDFGDHAVAFEADVRDRAAIEGVIGATVERFGRLDAVITCAGAITGGVPAWELTASQWQVMLDVNLTGTFNAIAAAVPHLLDQPKPRHGRIVAIASAAAETGLPLLASYSAAKHGVIGLVRSLARDLGDSGITANAISPGSTDTAMLKASAAIYGLRSPTEFERNQANGTLIEPNEIAAAVEWLCRPSTRSTTGAVIGVDGGFFG